MKNILKREMREINIDLVFANGITHVDGAEILSHISQDAIRAILKCDNYELYSLYVSRFGNKPNTYMYMGALAAANVAAKIIPDEICLEGESSNYFYYINGVAQCLNAEFIMEHLDKNNAIQHNRSLVYMFLIHFNRRDIIDVNPAYKYLLNGIIMACGTPRIYQNHVVDYVDMVIKNKYTARYILDEIKNSILGCGVTAAFIAVISHIFKTYPEHIGDAKDQFKNIGITIN